MQIEQYLKSGVFSSALTISVYFKLLHNIHKNTQYINIL